MSRPKTPSMVAEDEARKLMDSIIARVDVSRDNRITFENMIWFSLMKFHSLGKMEGLDRAKEIFHSTLHKKEDKDATV